MKKQFLLSVALFVFCFCTFSQQYHTPKNEAELRSLIEQSSAKIKTVQCDFLQEKKMSMMKEKTTSKGVFYFNQPNQVRLEYRQPNFQAMIVNGTNAFLQDKNKITKVSMAKSKAFQQLNKIIVSSVTGSILESKDFSTKLFENEKAVKVELTPTSKTVRDFLSSIVLILDKKDFSATRLELNENGGDYTYLTFSNKSLNKALPETLFKVQ
ncbi:MAG TPA: outer membrane lipoprotein carrier protein LolA [Chitinophagales bacterium]|nr:outer membrane lipoprotein carrier protein LolA [Chitinophagales bacterium]